MVERLPRGLIKMIASRCRAAGQRCSDGYLRQVFYRNNIPGRELAFALERITLVPAQMWAHASRDELTAAVLVDFGPYDDWEKQLNAIADTMETD